MKTATYGSLVVDGDDLYWLEGRPMEGGRQVVVRRRPDGTTEDLLPVPFNARSRVHEYGGGAYTVRRGRVYFVNFTDQAVYQFRPGAAPELGDGPRGSGAGVRGRGSAKASLPPGHRGREEEGAGPDAAPSRGDGQPELPEPPEEMIQHLRDIVQNWSSQ